MPGQPGLLRGAHRVVRMAQGQLGLLQEGQARIRGQHPSRCPLQQPGAQLAFQATDLLAQRGRHHPQVGRGPPHAAQLDHTHKITQLP